MIESSTLCVNGKHYFHRYQSQEWNGPLDLLSWIAEQKIYPKCYWKERGGSKEIAAVGSLLTLHEVPCFDQGNDSPAKFWGGHAFSPSSPSKDGLWKSFPKIAFFLPKYEIIRHGDTCEVLTHALNGPIVDDIDLSFSFFANEPLKDSSIKHFPSKENWNRLIDGSLEKIEAQELQKVVMGRRLSRSFSDTLDPYELLSKLKEKQSYRFALQFAKNQVFIGASPERLYKRKGRDLWSEAIAGTRKRGATDIEDTFLEKELFESEKEQREFAFVKTSMQEKLAPLCEELLHEPKDGIQKTASVQHLCNYFTATIKDSVDDAKILSALHPTAAMGGLPHKSAIEHLLTAEPFERGWYASPIGYIAQDEAELVVAIRSALIEEKTMHLFSAAGIVEGSTAEQEWEELDHKTDHWKQVLQ